MSRLLTLCPRLIPATMRRKLILATNLYSYSFGYYPKIMTIGDGWDLDQVVNWELLLKAPTPASLNLSVDLLIHFSLIYEQDPEVLNLGQQLTPKLKGLNHHFMSEWHRGADSYPSRFTLGCKPSKYVLEVLVWWSQLSYIIWHRPAFQIQIGLWPPGQTNQGKGVKA